MSFCSTPLVTPRRIELSALHFSCQRYTPCTRPATEQTTEADPKKSRVNRMISTLRLPSFLPCASCITTLDFGWLRALVIPCECTPKLKKAFGTRCFSYYFTFCFSRNFLLPRHWTTDFLSLRRERNR